MSEIDTEFEELVKQMNAKLKEATEALREVNSLRKKACLPSLIATQYTSEDMEEDEYEEFQEKLELLNTSQLERELDEAGWSTSSSYC